MGIGTYEPKVVGKVGGEPVYESDYLADESAVLTALGEFASYALGKKTKEKDFFMLAMQAMSNLARAVLGSSSFWAGVSRFKSGLSSWSLSMSDLRSEIPSEVSKVFAPGDPAGDEAAQQEAARLMALSKNAQTGAEAAAGLS